MTQYHYTECGLQNVYINGLPTVTDDDGDEVIHIPFINELHAMIAMGIVKHAKGMSGAELRFLRSEMGYTQVELAGLVHKDKQTIGRWERSEIDIDSTSETVIRKFAIEKLSIPFDDGIEALAKSSVPTAQPQLIGIDVESDGYKLQAA
ncbi:MAG: transcriptional regulator [Rhodobacteraceae bacterium]|nr:transcriptional regulator [Paracoccaceae bacterium]